MALNPALVGARPAQRRPALLGWLARAVRRLGWQHVALAALLGGVLHPLIGPNGGVLFFTGQRNSDAIANFLHGSYLTSCLPIVFAALVADAAVDDGVPPLRAYGLALLAGALFAPLLSWFVGHAVGWNRLPPNRFPGWYNFSISGNLLQGGLCMAVYGYWRTTQRSLEQVQRAQADRVHDQQRLLTVQLLALQARVEPQFLFDTLSRVGRLHVDDPARADALLADLIALLRAMLPGSGAAVSDVARELALVDAWLRVAGTLDRPLRVHIEAPAAELAGRAVAPMLVMPMLRGTLAQPAWARLEWRLCVADTLGGGLRFDLQALDSALAEALSEMPTLDDLRTRLEQLHGEAAQLTLLRTPPQVRLELPTWPDDAARHQPSASIESAQSPEGPP